MANYGSISVSEEDLEEYKAFRAELSEELGADLSVAQVIKMAMTFYKQRRKLTREKADA